MLDLKKRLAKFFLVESLKEDYVKIIVPKDLYTTKNINMESKRSSVKPGEFSGHISDNFDQFLKEFIRAATFNR